VAGDGGLIGVLEGRREKKEKGELDEIRRGDGDDEVSRCSAKEEHLERRNDERKLVVSLAFKRERAKKKRTVLLLTSRRVLLLLLQLRQTGSR